MDIQALKKRLATVDPSIADIVAAFGLALLVCAQIYLVTHIDTPNIPLPPGHRMELPRRDFGGLPYLVGAATFLPLAFRRDIPWLSLAFSGTAAAIYSLMPFPPAFVLLGPMVALFSLASYARRRHMGLIALLVVGLVLSVPIIAYSAGVRWVAESVGAFAMLAAAALLGDGYRNRREYVAEVEARALEAERTREEEALRRVEEERVRIAREVHDIIAHSLSIVTVQAAAAEAVIDKDPAQAKESLQHIRRSGREALGDLRSMLDMLRAGESDVPLAPAVDLADIGQLAKQVRGAGLDVRLTIEGDLAAVPAYASVSAYRIVQEALTNAVRHARASMASVYVGVSRLQLRVEIQDNGRGGTGEASPGGHGISGMRERVEALNGRFEAGPVDSGGFRVAATIPLPGGSS